MPSLRRLLTCFTTKYPNQSSEDESIEVVAIRPRTASKQANNGTASVPSTATTNATTSRESPVISHCYPRDRDIESTRGKAMNQVPYIGADTSGVSAKVDDDDPDAITPVVPPVEATATATPDPTGPMYTNVKNALEDRRKLFERLRGPRSADTEAVVGRSNAMTTNDVGVDGERGGGERSSVQSMEKAGEVAAMGNDKAAKSQDV